MKNCNVPLFPSIDIGDSLNMNRCHIWSGTVFRSRWKRYRRPSCRSRCSWRSRRGRQGVQGRRRWCRGGSSPLPLAKQQPTPADDWREIILIGQVNSLWFKKGSKLVLIKIKFKKGSKLVLIKIKFLVNSSRVPLAKTATRPGLWSQLEDQLNNLTANSQRDWHRRCRPDCSDS